MRSSFQRIVVVVLLGLVATNTRAPEVSVHRRITRSAGDAAIAYRKFLTDVFGPGMDNRLATPTFGKFTSYGWLEEGCEREDDRTRGRQHFYDPVSGKGLTDGVDGWAQNSFDWCALRYGGLGSLNFILNNQWTWPVARDREFEALTSASKSVRDKKYGDLFRSLGQVIHLNQDLSQPSHTRNDNHLIERGYGWFTDYDFVEKYGGPHANDGTILYPLGLLDWRAAG